MDELLTKEELSEIASKAMDRAIKKEKRHRERIVAELTMPNVGSWNGKWTGDSDKHTILVKGKNAKELIGNYYYNFGDGWGASVEIRKAKPREKITNQFAGYEWMVESIKKHGVIKT
jgi:hypothetical protein